LCKKPVQVQFNQYPEKMSALTPAQIMKMPRIARSGLDWFRLGGCSEIIQSLLSRLVGSRWPPALAEESDQPDDQAEQDEGISAIVDDT
jgi:hypothetical protein